MKTKAEFSKLALTILVFGLFILEGCGNYTLVCNGRDPVEEAGINHFQKLVDQINQYKIEHGKYPANVKELGPNIFDNGVKYPNPKITGASGTLKPEEDYFSVQFFFDREKTCLTLIGNNRACAYTSEAKKWSCY